MPATERKRCRYCGREYSPSYIRKHESICPKRKGAS